ncbi:MAG: LPS assembly protein LptD [Rhodospirillales bacterium]
MSGKSTRSPPGGASRPPEARVCREWGQRLRRALVAAALAAAVGAASPPSASAAEAPSADRPVQFQADEMTFDSRNRVTTARGNVVVIQDQRRLLADVLTYDENADLLTATGNVTLYEPSGEVIRASSLEVTGDLKNGVIEDLRAVLADGSRLNAASGERSNGNLTRAHEATYTPCFPCEEDPSRAPLWQVRAVKVTHNQERRIVEFNNAWLDFSGVPVFYFPYFYQPDPTVKRKSGLLIPGFGQSSDLGFMAKIPYYAVLSDSQDLTITPWFTSNEGPVLELQYRQALQHGSIDFTGSGTYDSNDNAMGHVLGKARYDIDDDWRAGLDAQRATNRTYTRRYGFDNSRTLTSRLYGENFRGSSDYLTGRVMAFQNLEDDIDQENVPYVAPWIDYYHVSDIDRFGGRTDVHLDTVALTREEGTDTRRLSARAQWQRPFVGQLGDIFTFTGALWSDGYNVNDETSEDRDNRYSGFSGRIFPQASAQWRLPLVREGETVQQVVEPIVEAVLAPNWGNPSRIPNEDSQNFELQDTNLFGLSRFPGLDRVDEGPRINYGLNWMLYGMGDASVSAFVGQSYQFYQDNTFGKGTGLQDNVSDIVSAIDVKPVEWLDVIYRNRLDHSTLKPERNELTLRVGVDAIRVGASYVRYQSQPQNNLASRQEAQYALDTQLTRYWRSHIFGTTDIQAESQREIGLRLVYEDECFIFSGEFARQDFRDKDVEPSNVVFFRVGLKTLGEFGSGFKPGGG